MSADELIRVVDRLVRQVGHWAQPRWAVPLDDAPAAGTDPPGSTLRATRADLMYGLVQRIADRAADAEGQPRRHVPRLDNDLALPDQLRVVTADLVAADPPAAVLAEAAAEVAATRSRL